MFAPAHPNIREALESDAASDVSGVWSSREMMQACTSESLRAAASVAMGVRRAADGVRLPHRTDGFFF